MCSTVRQEWLIQDCTAPGNAINLIIKIKFKICTRIPAKSTYNTISQMTFFYCFQGTNLTCGWLPTNVVNLLNGEVFSLHCSAVGPYNTREVKRGRTFWKATKRDRIPKHHGRLHQGKLRPKCNAVKATPHLHLVKTIQGFGECKSVLVGATRHCLDYYLHNSAPLLR